MELDTSTPITHLLPKSLDDIIRVKRDEIELRLSSIPEIDALVEHFPTIPDPKDEMNNWRLVSLVDRISNSAQVLLIGDSRAQKHPGITSPVIAIDFEHGIAVTRSNSVYKLGNRGLGEPPENDLFCICAAMHSWGKGQTFGVPHFAY